MTTTDRTAKIVARKREHIAELHQQIGEIEAEIAELERPAFAKGDRVQLTDTVGDCFKTEDLDVIWTITHKKFHHDPTKVSIEAAPRDGYGWPRLAMNIPISSLRKVS